MFPLVGPITAVLAPQLVAASSAEFADFDAALAECAAALAGDNLPLADQVDVGVGPQDTSLSAVNVPVQGATFNAGVAAVLCTPTSDRFETAGPVGITPIDAPSPYAAAGDKPLAVLQIDPMTGLSAPPLVDPARTEPPFLPAVVPRKSALPDHKTVCQPIASMPQTSGLPLVQTVDAEPVTDDPVLPVRAAAPKPKPPVRRIAPAPSGDAENTAMLVPVDVAPAKVLSVRPDKAPPAKQTTVQAPLTQQPSLPETAQDMVSARSPATAVADVTAKMQTEASSIFAAPHPIEAVAQGDGDTVPTGARLAEPEKSSFSAAADFAAPTAQAEPLADVPLGGRRQIQGAPWVQRPIRPELPEAEVPMPLVENAGPKVEQQTSPAPRIEQRIDVQAADLAASKTQTPPETRWPVVTETRAQTGFDAVVVRSFPQVPTLQGQVLAVVADQPIDRETASAPVAPVATPAARPVPQITAPPPLNRMAVDAPDPSATANSSQSADGAAQDQPSLMTALPAPLPEPSPIGISFARVPPAHLAAPEMAAQLRVAPPIVPQILHSLGHAAEKGDRIEVSLSPKELGQLRVEITQAADGAKVIVTAERPETLELVRRHAQELVAEFRQAGLGHASLSFGTWSGQDASQRGTGAQGNGGDQGRGGVWSGDPATPDRPAETVQASYPQRAENSGGLILRI